MRTTRICSIPGCGNKHRGRGFCQFHYKRWYRLGDPLAIARPYGESYLSGDGYRIFSKNGKQLREHRMVMEEFLGRPLLSHENVHHKNLDRADNRIGNLELWITSQPSGARVEDMVPYWKEMLALYDHGA